MDWLRHMLGLPTAFSGVIQDSRQHLHLVRPAVRPRARHRLWPEHGGLQGEAAPLVVYASDQAHSSVAKAALLAGFGARQPAPGRHRRRARPAPRPARGRHRRRPGRGPPAVRRGRHGRHHGHHGPRPGGRRRRLAAAHGLWLHVDAALGRRGHDLPGVPPPVGRRRACRLARVQPAQVARHRLRPLGLLRARPGAPAARHEHQPELPAHRPGRQRAQPARLGHTAGPAFSRPQALVPAARPGRRRPAGPHPPRPRQRPVAGRSGARPRRDWRLWRRRRCRPSACATSRARTTRGPREQARRSPTRTPPSSTRRAPAPSTC